MVDLKTGITTDENGVFRFKHLHQRVVHVQISYIGYKIIDRVINIDETNDQKYYLEPSHLDIEEVVVSAPSGRLQGENIVSVEHIKISDLQQNAPVSLAEAITNIPGVD